MLYIFWVKSVAKDNDYYKNGYNLNNLSYILTNYELDCAVSGYRTRLGKKADDEVIVKITAGNLTVTIFAISSSNRSRASEI